MAAPPPSSLDDRHAQSRGAHPLHMSVMLINGSAPESLTISRRVAVAGGAGKVSYESELLEQTLSAPSAHRLQGFLRLPTFPTLRDARSRPPSPSPRVD
jgi:hypothetical protein